ncbi:Ppx/GppA phosphatase family protein [Cyclobacterium jeungdonense]|uniref:Exopolyphosphatase n=1 Tax=Cyclobacterium jeungdonense TaxID=708087 RepID=A0ABT8C1R9_9BACT|nr:exopolyphosphatase [Cyclobacterium jeungdonense]MDN3686681.1 exopolyphosphatase [Cyclobacterium jeungdonense]
MKKKAAVIDMGTNTFHLLMVALDEKGFETLYKEKVPVKIGQGGINQNLILPDAQKRALHTLDHFKHLIRGEHIDQVFAFATSAVRNAENGDVFVQKIHQQTGFTVQVIDGDREAELIYKGIRMSGCLDDSNALMMDIGGGSVEFIIGNRHETYWKGSFEIGGQRMLDLFHHQDPMSQEDRTNLTEYLSQHLKPLLVAIRQYQPKQLVGASGTFDTLTDIFIASTEEIKNRAIHKHLLPLKAFYEISDRLIQLNKEERLQIPGMISMRVDMIVVASCLIRYILRQLDSGDLLCSTYSLKEGVLAEIMEQADRNQDVTVNTLE